jgi:glycosyltransferase involved in cell wall biosynthesis
MKTILFVHQSAEMYGSDKVLLSLVRGMDKDAFQPVVMLPAEGPLLDALRESNITTLVLPLVKIQRSTLSLRGILRIPGEIARSLKAMDRSLRNIHVDIVHSNTLAVLSGALWAKMKGLPHVWHVHEMIVHPIIVRRIFSFLVRALSSRVICISDAVRQLLVDSEPSLHKRCTVVWNGVERQFSPDAECAARIRLEAGVINGSLAVVLVGRINRWKGHLLLVETAEILWKRGFRNIFYICAGSAPAGQEHFKSELAARIADSLVRERIILMDYRQDVWPLWDASDIAVVPSIEPEPFGLVALEAMISGKPVVAAAHGGLPEIVEDSVTGILFEPNNPNKFADAIADLAVNEGKRILMGEKGYERVRDIFNAQRYIGAVESLYREILR